jgi:hypothetical protein
MVVARRPPKTMPSIGTPSGFCHSGSIDGHCDGRCGEAGVGVGADAAAIGCPVLAGPVDGVGRRLAVHAFPPDIAVIGEPDVGEDAVGSDGFHGRGLVLYAVPGATPKYPVSGLMACSLPSSCGQSQAMSSPMIVVFQPAS